MRIRPLHLFTLALIAILALVPFSAARADSMSITYFTIASTDNDANHLGYGFSSNEVLTMLGPNGLPLLNPTLRSPGGTRRLT